MARCRGMGDDLEGDDFEAAFPRLLLIAFRVAYRILGRVNDAEDVAAETLGRALIAWKRLAGQPHQEAWVAKVAANRAIDVFRQARHLALQPDREAVDPAEAAVLRVALVAALKGLSRRQRQVVALRYLAGFSEGEVARSLGISLNSVKKHTLRGVSALRARLGEDWQEAQVVLD
ncbi:MAG: sigma-70 family RNA polymerase sigma factor [Acidimicrobiales bacterium]